MSTIETLTVQEMVEQEKGPIYLLNTSHRSEVGLPGDVFISINLNNQVRSLKVPLTWIPTEATRLYPRKYLLESPNFLEALSKNIITAITEKSAMALKAKKGYREEENRLREIEASVREASRAKGVGKNVTVSGGEDLNEEDVESTTAVKRKNVSVVSVNTGSEIEDKATVSAGFVAWVNKLNAMEDLAKARNEVRIRGELSEEEAHYFLENTIYPSFKRSLAKKLGRD